jgi:two-component system CheB/CheR fusion protein
MTDDLDRGEDLPTTTDGDGAGTVAPDDAEWAALLRYLQTARGFDFHGYKTNTLARRIRKRMAGLAIDRFGAYQDYLEVHQDEFETLFNTILINVTGFFRDAAAWDALRELAIPAIVGARSAGEPIRAWSAGCASGEEAYTIAMLLAEALGPERYRDQAKIYATDVDEDALNTARHATYTASQVAGVPADLLDRYFERLDGLYVFRSDLRRQVIYGRHDLISDAPISRIDLLACRNTLMYFNAETQARILARFYFALNEGGFLLLGRAETLMAQGNAFAPVDLKRRLSRKNSHALPKMRRPIMVPDDESDRAGDTTRFAALESSPVAQLVVGLAGEVLLLNDKARTLFNLRESDVGRPLRDLQLSYRPVELRSLIERAEVERRPVALKSVEWVPHPGDVRWLDLHVSPLASADGGVIGTAVAFTDATAYRRLQQELEETHRKLEGAYEALQSANEELQSTNEELETTNEELQSTVEELETTNEELQSTNEEMETMNEELQSTNEELQTMNDELRLRGDQVDSANAFLHAVVGSLNSGVVVTDRDLKVLAWNQRAEDLWGLRADETLGQHFLGLDIGLPVDDLRPALRACLSGESADQQLALDAINRRGRAIRCEVRVAPLLGHDTDIRGTIMLMDDSVQPAPA